MVRNFNKSTIFQITNIIENILKVNYFPQAWKTSSVIPILKPGKDPTLPESFRPILLLPVLTARLLSRALHFTPASAGGGVH
ncbi:hypothetical protein TNCV_2578731 [Trichonephila clavipes]|nr:hypothetical protein TNCV_2578731 [Trichonephila clavipes]